MRLPYLPSNVKSGYREMAYQQKKEKDIIAFRGLNLSGNTQDGDFTDSKNLSFDAYPKLTQREKASVVAGYNAPSDFFEWDGHKIVIDGGALLYDGENLCGVEDGRKQFAVVNTKLIVWPDRIQIDLTNKTVEPMDREVTNRGAASFTENSVTLENTPKAEAILKYNSYTPDARITWFYAYETAEWADGEWVLDGGDWVPQDSIDGKIVLPNAAYSETLGKYSFNFPDITKIARRSQKPTAAEPPHGNELGYYAVMQAVDQENTTSGTYVKTENNVYYSPNFNPIDCFEGFHAGEAVDIIGTEKGVNDRKAIVIASVENNKIVFDEFENKFISDGEFVFTVGDTKRKGTDLQFRIDTNKYGRLTLEQDFDEDMIATSVYEGGFGEITFLRHGVVLFKQKCSSYGDIPITGVDAATRTVYAEDNHFTVKRSIPKMDFICAKNNRLYGISNATDNKVYNTELGKYDEFTSRIIYVSSLGKPMNFWNFDGTDADSYQVAVGSNGDFTGICAYGDSVLCWKENILHKLLGDFPSEFRTADYHIAGVQAGSHRSLTVINETLFYKGALGVYAFSGGVPSLISEKLGAKQYGAAVGGTDGKRYYISMDGATYFYDLSTGLWMKQSDESADAFAIFGGVLHYIADGKIVKTDAASDEKVEWMAEFAPFDTLMLGNRKYNKILLNMDMEAGSLVEIEISGDGSRWKRVFQKTAQKRHLITVPLAINRRERFAMRLSGKGKVTVHDIGIEYQTKSER